MLSRALQRSCAVVLGLLCATATIKAETLSFYGTPGLVDIPTAETFQDGNLSISRGEFGTTLRNTLSFQISPNVYGSFRYSILEGFDQDGASDRFDRSFDLHIQLWQEHGNRPALAFGLRDFGGTGIYSSEYVVATKTFADRLSVTGGLGWGRLAGRNSFGSPFGWLSDAFADRPDPSEGGIEQTGRLDADSWFRGDVAPFGGLTYRATDRLTVMAEYSPDLYRRETAQTDFKVDSPFNYGLSYRFGNGIDLGGYYLYGSEIGIRLSYTIDPAKPRIPGGLDPAPPALAPRKTLASVSWNLPDRPDGTPSIRQVLFTRLQDEGMRLEGFELTEETIRVRVENQRYRAFAQAAGRTARVLANTLPPAVEEFHVTFVQNGLPITTIITQRSDFEELETDYDGAWRTLARARITDGASDFNDTIEGAYPRFDWRIGPYTALSLFDPDDPIRYEVGAEVSTAYVPAPGFVLSGRIRRPFQSTIDDATRRSNSVIQRVRSDSILYAVESELEINHLTLEHFFRPGQDLFGRVTAGYLETMYGGVSGELLWYPVGSHLAFGFEANYARQRDFDMLWGFQDYDVLTGHGSVYYDLGNGYLGQIDMGRYLAEDWGATFTLDREFNNGFRVGAFFTLTTVSFDDFGEGSFDRGIRLEVPLAWLTGRPSRGSLGQVIRPVLRDGGARLEVRNRLYEFTRDARGQELSDRWGRYYR